MGGWHYIFIGLGLILLAFTCYKEYTRPNKKRLLLRLAASITAVACLTCMALNITYKKAVQASGSAVITTDGYNKDSLAAFIKNNPGAPVYTFDEYIANGSVHYSALHTFGYGLTTDELTLLRDASIVLHPTGSVQGIAAANWQQTLQTGQQLVVQGSYNNTGSTPVTLQLNGLNTLFDSVTIQPGRQQNFSLGTVPKQAGKAVYNLTVLANDKVIEEEFIPVEITATDSLKVLVLASAPGFENRFLKNWLSQNGYAVTVRSTTSKNKFDRSFVNTPSSSIDKITTQSLAGYDILISDATELNALSKDEQNAIQSSVENGLGLMIKADTALPSSLFYSSFFPVHNSASSTPQTITLHVNNTTLQPAVIEQPAYIQPQRSTQTLVADSAGNAVVSSTVYGVGRLAVTTINNTYSWVLTGNNNSYTTYWSTILSNLARKKAVLNSMRYTPAFAVVNQPVHVTFTSNANPQPVINGGAVALRQGVQFSYEWDGTYWPAQTGWQTVVMGNDTASFYVYSNADWQYARGLQKTHATYYYAHQRAEAYEAAMQSTQHVPVNKLYFLIALMVCCAFLWLERKFA